MSGPVNEEPRSSGEKKWVKFEENQESPPMSQESAASYNGAVIDTETVQVDIDKVKQGAQSSTQEVTNLSVSSLRNQNAALRNISLEEAYSSGLTHTIIDPSIQRGFGNRITKKFLVLLPLD